MKSISRIREWFSDFYVAWYIGRYGRIYIEGRREEAFVKYLALLEKYPTNTDLLRTLAAVYLRERRYDKSKMMCNRVLALEPNETMASGCLKRICEEEGETGEIAPVKSGTARYLRAHK